MRTKLQNLRVLDGRQILAISAVVLILCAILVGAFAGRKAQAATASTLNFQARLMNDTGSIAPDGDYNLEFKLYNTESTGGTAQGTCTGNCVWVETRTSTDAVRVANGYVSVNLGSVTAFGSSIDWNQDLWLTMNVGGTGTPSWDGEMTPRLRLTAVPYAFSAGGLSKVTGANTSTLGFDTQTAANDILLPDEGGVLCIQSSSNCGFVEGSATDFIQNQNASQQATSNFWISGAGRADIALQAPLFDTPTAVALDVGTTNATQINLNKNTFIAADQDLTLQNGSGVLSQTFSSDSAASAQVLSATNANSGASSVDVNGYSIALAGTATSGGTNTNSALRFANPSAAANNVFYGLNFEGTGYTDILKVGSTQIINGSGVVQSDGISGSYTGITGVGTLTAGSLGSGFTTIDVAQGGTGATSFTSNGLIYGNGTGALQVTAAGTNGQCLVGNTGSAPSWGTCLSSVSIDLQEAYDASTSPEIVVNGTNGAVTIRRDAGGSVSTLFEVQSNDGTTTYMSVGVAGVSITGTLGVSALGSADTASYLCYNGSGQVASCNTTGNGAAFVQGGNDFDATAVLGTNDTDDLQFKTNNVVRATFDQANSMYLGNGVTAGAPNDFTISGTGSSATGVTGGSLALQGGDATSGNANGGDLLLSGGAGFGTGVSGLVVLGTPTVSTTIIDANCGATTSVDCTIAASTVNNSGSVVVGATASDVTITMPDPTNTTAGRVFYFTASGASTNDFELELNSGGTLIEVAMKANSTATLIWNGSDWTVGGASSSTTLQAAYNNTLSSAGGAEIVLNNTATSNGLTVRNNDTNPIIGGGLLEVQTSIGTNLFSVNNNISELVANGGAENGDTFSTDWTALGTSTVSRSTTTGQYVTGTAGASIEAGTTAGNGVRNNLASNPALSTTYMISFTAKLASGSPAFADLRVDYTPTGASTGTQCIADQTIVSTEWTRITCEVVTPATSVTDADVLIYQVAAPGTARTFYLENLSMTLADDAGGIPNNVQIGGGINGGSPTLFTLDRSSAPPVANDNSTYLGSMYYDTVSGRIQCYEADGWGACGSAPNNDVNLLPEFPGAVLHGSGVGTLTADFCSDTLNINDGSSGQPTICSTNDTINYYRWTSPQATQQTYSIIVTHQLPVAFKNFDSDDTVRLTARTDNTTNGEVTFEMYRDDETLGLVQCGTGETSVTTTANTWQTVGINGNESQSCGFSSASANDFVIFKINVKAKSNANVYVGNLSFTTIGQ
jgi:hypothetical protein